MNLLIQSKNEIILPVLIALTLGCFGPAPQARAVCQRGCLTIGKGHHLGTLFFLVGCSCSEEISLARHYNVVMIHHNPAKE
jgi:hypothetical protein